MTTIDNSKMICDKYSLRSGNKIF